MLSNLKKPTTPAPQVSTMRASLNQSRGDNNDISELINAPKLDQHVRFNIEQSPIKFKQPLIWFESIEKNTENIKL